MRIKARLYPFRNVGIIPIRNDTRPIPLIPGIGQALFRLVDSRNWPSGFPTTLGQFREFTKLAEWCSDWYYGLGASCRVFFRKIQRVCLSARSRKIFHPLIGETKWLSTYDIIFHFICHFVDSKFRYDSAEV